MVYSQIWLNLPKDHKLTHSAGFCSSSKHRKTTGLKFHPWVKPLASDSKRTGLALKLSIVCISSFVSSFVSSSTIYFHLFPCCRSEQQSPVQFFTSILIYWNLGFGIAFLVQSFLEEMGTLICTTLLAAGGGMFAMGTVVVACLLACAD